MYFSAKLYNNVRKHCNAHTEHPRMNLFGKADAEGKEVLATAFVGFPITSATGYVTNLMATKPLDYHTVSHMSGVFLSLAEAFGNQTAWFPSFSSEH